MSLFKRKNIPTEVKSPATFSQGSLAELALRVIHDGVVITDGAGVIKFLNPAAVVMTECGSIENALGLDYDLIIKIESKEKREFLKEENPLIVSMSSFKALENFECILVSSLSDKRIPVSLSIIPVGGAENNRIITFRNIEKELKEESEQTEFISTASHEMRTPVASIEGYLSLALNPQTATIDERAKGYLTSAHEASQHLGRLFRDLLDVTKLDDNRMTPHLVPVEMISLTKRLSDEYAARFKEAGLNYVFGSHTNELMNSAHQIPQVAYSFVDTDFTREIIANLIDNAIKYSKAGGAVYVNAKGDGDHVLVSIADTGIGIPAKDLPHIFQKFYRADNSDTRTIGGTGLGLYLVKQRVEAMGGKIWAESTFGKGTTFYVSLPRISSEEYEKRMIAINNENQGGQQ